jgi:hypothetical protein
MGHPEDFISMAGRIFKITQNNLEDRKLLPRENW